MTTRAKSLRLFAANMRKAENSPWGVRGGERVLTPITLLITNQPTEHCTVCGSLKALGRACSRCNF